MLQIGSDKRWEGFTGLHYMTKISIILFDFQSESLIDVKEVFDSENHSIFLSNPFLLSTLYNYGIRAIVHNWFKSYLTNRKQRHYNTKNLLSVGSPRVQFFDRSAGGRP